MRAPGHLVAGIVAFLFPFLAPADDLVALGDEFGSNTTLTRWLQINDVEGWGTNQLEGFDINSTVSGHRAALQNAPRRSVARPSRFTPSAGSAVRAAGAARLGVLRPGGALDCHPHGRFRAERISFVGRAIQSGARAPHSKTPRAEVSRAPRFTPSARTPSAFLSAVGR